MLTKFFWIFTFRQIRCLWCHISKKTCFLKCVFLAVCLFLWHWKFYEIMRSIEPISQRNLRKISTMIMLCVPFSLFYHPKINSKIQVSYISYSQTSFGLCWNLIYSFSRALFWAIFLLFQTRCTQLRIIPFDLRSSRKWEYLPRKLN